MLNNLGSGVSQWRLLHMETIHSAESAQVLLRTRRRGTMDLGGESLHHLLGELPIALCRRYGRYNNGYGFSNKTIGPFARLVKWMYSSASQLEEVDWIRLNNRTLVVASQPGPGGTMLQTHRHLSNARINSLPHTHLLSIA